VTSPALLFGMVNLARERALNKACFKPVCITTWLQFDLSILVNLTFGAETQEEASLTRLQAVGALGQALA
jgi:hypothetical protein